MELSLSSEDAAFRDEVRAFIAENYPQEMRVPNPETDLTKEQMLLWHRILLQEGMDRAAVAEGIWRAGLVDHAALHLRTGDVARRNAAAAGVQRHHGRPGDLHLRQRGAEEEVPAADPLRRGLVVPGLLRAGLGLRPRIGRAPRRCATATTTSSTARRPGPRWRSTPTGSSAWCAPIRRPSRRPASRSC